MENFAATFANYFHLLRILIRCYSSFLAKLLGSTCLRETRTRLNSWLGAGYAQCLRSVRSLLLMEDHYINTSSLMKKSSISSHSSLSPLSALCRKSHAVWGRPSVYGQRIGSSRNSKGANGLGPVRPSQLGRRLIMLQPDS